MDKTNTIKDGRNRADRRMAVRREIKWQSDLKRRLRIREDRRQEGVEMSIIAKAQAEKRAVNKFGWKKRTLPVKPLNKKERREKGATK
jgi:hypothetical protein